MTRDVNIIKNSQDEKFYLLPIRLNLNLFVRMKISSMNVLLLVALPTDLAIEMSAVELQCETLKLLILRMNQFTITETRNDEKK